MAIKRMKLSSSDTAKINRTDSIKRFEATLKKRTIEKFEEIELIREYQKTGDQRLKERIGSLSDSQLPVVDEALGVSLGIANLPENR